MLIPRLSGSVLCTRKTRRWGGRGSQSEPRLAPKVVLSRREGQKRREAFHLSDGYLPSNVCFPILDLIAPVAYFLTAVAGPLIEHLARDTRLCPGENRAFELARRSRYGPAGRTYSEAARLYVYAGWMPVPPLCGSGHFVDGEFSAD